MGEFKDREDELMGAIKKTKEEGKYHTILLMITDILNQGSRVFTVSDEIERVAKALEIELDQGKAYKEGLMSRKKQIIPVFSKEFDK